MLYLNQVELIGNLTADAELVELESGTKLAKFSMAINWSTGEKEGVEYVNNIEYFGKVENLVPHMTKGKNVMVTGRLKTDSWEDAESGKKRSALKVSATNVQLG